MKNKKKLLNRIVSDPNILTGKPIIRGYRMSVEHILKMLGAGLSLDEIQEDYPFLEQEDIQACMLVAAVCPAKSNHKFNL